MAKWDKNNILLTAKGREVLSKVQTGIGKITVTRIVTGAGRVPPAQLVNQLVVSNIKQELRITQVTTTESGSNITSILSNTDLHEGYLLQQFGIYVNHPDFTGEVLYLIAQCENTPEDPPEHIPAIEDSPVSLEYKFYMEHSGTSKVSVTIDPAGMATMVQLLALESKITLNVQEIDDVLQPHVNNEDIHVTLDNKARWDDTYTKTEVNDKVDFVKVGLNGHTENLDIHTNVEERTRWNNTYTTSETDLKLQVLSEGLTQHARLETHITPEERVRWNDTNTKEEVKTSITNLTNYVNRHIQNASLHVTGNDREIWGDKYTKMEVDNLFSSLETNTQWKPSVPTYVDIAITYPNPQDGWTVNTDDTDYTYRFTGVEWITVSANAIPKATEDLDGLMSKEWMVLLGSAVREKHEHMNLDILSGINQFTITEIGRVAPHIKDLDSHTSAEEKINWNDKYTRTEVDTKFSDNLGGLKLKKMTQAQYEALVTKDTSTLYVIVG